MLTPWSACELATRYTLRFFDAVLVDRALHRGMPLLTSDRKLANAVSAADCAVTRRLVAAGHLLGIPLVASLVVEPSATHDLVSDRTWRS